MTDTDNLRSRLLLQLDDYAEAATAAAHAGALYEDAKRIYDAAWIECERKAEDGEGPAYSNATKRKYEAKRLLDTRFPGVRENYEVAVATKREADALAALRLEALKTYRSAATLMAAELEANATAESVAPMLHIGRRS